MLEGATGDITVTGPDPKYKFKAHVEERPVGKKTFYYWKEGGTERDFTPSGRVNWFGKDPAWQNVLGFHGKNDVEKGVGEWNTLVVTMKGDTMTNRLNGVILTKATNLGVTRGKLQIQSEGSEIHFKKIILTPLD
jgi:hypothetical protein